MKSQKQLRKEYFIITRLIHSVQNRMWDALDLPNNKINISEMKKDCDTYIQNYKNWYVKSNN